MEIQKITNKQIQIQHGVYGLGNIECQSGLKSHSIQRSKSKYKDIHSAQSKLSKNCGNRVKLDGGGSESDKHTIQSIHKVGLGACISSEITTVINANVGLPDKHNRSTK